MKRHRDQDFIRFLNTIEAQVPKRKTIHAIVCYSQASEKACVACQASPLDLPLHPNFRILAQRHRRFFAKLTRQRLKRGVFRSVDELKAVINRYIAETNGDPKPFVWTADPHRVLAAVKRGKQALESLH